MENFFYEEKFCTDIEDLLSTLDIDKEDIIDLPNNWEITCFKTELEPIFVLDKDTIRDIILNTSEQNEERFPEDPDRVDGQIKQAIEKGIDLANSLLPKLYYPTSDKFTITKTDLLNYII